MTKIRTRYRIFQLVRSQESIPGQPSSFVLQDVTSMTGFHEGFNEESNAYHAMKNIEGMHRGSMNLTILPVYTGDGFD
jgi:hypothetical protein